MSAELGSWGVPVAVLAGAIRVSTPFIFVSLGECITERSGRVNLGLEGTLVMGAMVGYGTSYLTGYLGSVCSAPASWAYCWARFTGSCAVGRGSMTSRSA